MMNQHEYVKGCLTFYQEEGLVPGDGPGWEDAHYPAPEGKGDTTIPMLHDNHQVQGLWQSKEYNQCCFFIGHAKRFLTEGPFVSGWFELWDIFDEISTMHLSAACSLGGAKAAELGVGIHGRSAEQMTEDSRRGGKIGGKRAVKLGVGIHGRSAEQMTEDRRKGGKRAVKLGVGIHGRSAEQMTEDSRKGSQTTNSQQWVCLDTGHVSTSGPLSRWQKARGIPTYLRIKVALQILRGEHG